ncbi:MAG: molybdopterin oxidoreductase family protein, partial [Ilumatobacteraceae bacterium]
LGAGPVVIVAGRGNLAESEAAAAATLSAVLAACPEATVLPALRRGNVVGALQLGMAPDGLDAIGILTAAAEGRIDLLVLLGADPIADCPDADLARRALAGARRVVAVDTFLTESSQQADVVLAAAAFGEQDGTTTNLEGRVSTVTQKVTPRGTARPDWMIAADLAERLDHLDVANELLSVEAITDGIAGQVPAYAGATRAALASTRNGVLAVPSADATALVPHGQDGDAPVRNRYDYRLVLSRQLYDRAVGTSRSPSLAPLAGNSAAHLHPLDLDALGVAAGDQVRVVAPRGTALLPVVSDPRVVRGSLRVPFNVAGTAVTDLIDAGVAATDVRVERI